MDHRIFQFSPEGSALKVNNASTLQFKTKYVFVLKKSSLISFYALPSSGKSKDAVVHSNI